MPQKTLLLSIVLAIVALLIGFIVGRGQPLSPPSPQKPAGVSTEGLPVSLLLLKSPTVTQWRADLEGTLVSKTTGAFTLEQAGSRVTVAVSPGTLFYNATRSLGGQNEQMSLEEIPEGAVLKGSAFVVGEGERMEANVFYMIPAPTR